jgi:hypothetical protein
MPDWLIFGRHHVYRSRGHLATEEELLARFGAVIDEARVALRRDVSYLEEVCRVGRGYATGKRSALSRAGRPAMPIQEVGDQVPPHI